jgi:hypothetical protein
MDIKLVKFNAMHGYKMDWQDKDEFDGIMEYRPMYFHELATSYQENCYTLMKGDTILAIWGIIPDTLGNYSLFMHMSTYYVSEFSREIYALTKSVVRNLSLETKRIYTTCRADNAKVIKFIKLNGFHQEGIMRKHGASGDDYVLFSLVEGD